MINEVSVVLGRHCTEYLHWSPLLLYVKISLQVTSSFCRTFTAFGVTITITLLVTSCDDYLLSTD